MHVPHVWLAHLTALLSRPPSSFCLPALLSSSALVSLQCLKINPKGWERVFMLQEASQFRGAAVMPLCAFPRHRAWRRPTVLSHLVLWSPGRDWPQAAEWLWWPVQQGISGPRNPQGLVSSHKNSQQFIFLVLGLNLPFVPCHCATLQVIALPWGSRECLPPGACVAQILQSLLCAEPCQGTSPCCFGTALLEPLVRGDLRDSGI